MPVRPDLLAGPLHSPFQFLACHCSKCRSQSGGTFVPFVALPRAAVLLDTPRLSTFRSSDIASRLLCSSCGSFVAMDYSEEHTVWLALSSVDTLPKGWEMVVERDSQIFHENKVSWGKEVCALTHKGSYGTYRPDPCALGGGEQGELHDGNILQRLADVATHKANE